MKNAYKFYTKIIKPIEKKYTRMCILYSILKWDYFKKRMIFYDRNLINYYKLLQTDNKNLRDLEKHLNK